MGFHSWPWGQGFTDTLSEAVGRIPGPPGFRVCLRVLPIPPPQLRADTGPFLLPHNTVSGDGAHKASFTRTGFRPLGA